MRTAPQLAYAAWIFISTVGLIQALVSYYGWTGLSFFRGRPRLGYAAALALVPSSYYWYFSLTDRNVPGLEGYQLFSRCLLAVFAGLLFVLIVSSLLNASMNPPRAARRPLPAPGIAALRTRTFASLMGDTLAASPPLRLARAAQRSSWARVLLLLNRLSASPFGGKAQPGQGEH